jgi:hypothetical protein
MSPGRRHGQRPDAGRGCRMVRVVALKYEAVHGHKPRQPRGYSIWPWAFQIDMAPTPVIFTASYNSGFTNLSSMPCSDLGCWVYYENTLPSNSRKGPKPCHEQEFPMALS